VVVAATTKRCRRCAPSKGAPPPTAYRDCGGSRPESWRRSSLTPREWPRSTRPARRSSISPKWPRPWPPTCRRPAWFRSDRPFAASAARWWWPGAPARLRSSPTGWWSAPGCRPTGWPGLPATAATRPSWPSGASTGGWCPERAHLVRGLIYPVPDPAYPFLGVHFTRRVGGAVDLGPNAVLALAREGYRRRDSDLADVAATLAWPGLLAHGPPPLAPRPPGAARVAVQEAFLAEARRLVPEVTTADVVAGPRRRASPGGRRRRQPGRRFPHRLGRRPAPGDDRPQRPIPRRHLGPGHRRAPRRRVVQGSSPIAPSTRRRAPCSVATSPKSAIRSVCCAAVTPPSASGPRLTPDV
jgi:hypothetical protein